VLKGFQGDASTQVMDDCCAVVSGGLWIVELPASSRRWVLAVTGRDSTEDMTSRRMIAATVLRELRLLGELISLSGRNGRGGSDYKL
jgi:hypothetical protein